MGWGKFGFGFGKSMFHSVFVFFCAWTLHVFHAAARHTRVRAGPREHRGAPHCRVRTATAAAGRPLRLTEPESDAITLHDIDQCFVD